MSITRPEIDFPGGEPPAELQITDIWEGDGGEAAPGDTVKVHYVGVSYSTGEEFDASWNRGDPLQFQLGAGRVIAGWDQGVQGMKVGGRRQLIIPPDLAYGDRGAGNACPRAVRDHLPRGQPFGAVLGGVLGEERQVVRHAVRVAAQRHRAPGDVRQQHRGDPLVVVENLGLGEAVRRVEHLGQVGQRQLPALDDHRDLVLCWHCAPPGTVSRSP